METRLKLGGKVPMPILPLDHPEPFAATLGVMLYPGTDNDDPAKARTFASHWLAKPIQRCEEIGHKISRDVLLGIVIDGGQVLDDLDERWRGGTATGELFKTLWALVYTDPTLATWSNAIKIAEEVAARAKTSGSRSALWEARQRFLSVAHLWAAWAIRGGKFDTRLERGYDDFQAFLAEAEILRDFGQTWQPARAKSKPLLPHDMWGVAENWKPDLPNPEIVKLPVPKLAEYLLSTLRPAGRPPKAP
jgi:hypothetical protein